MDVSISRQRVFGSDAWMEAGHPFHTSIALTERED
jgi:hypothetical protein